MLVNLCGAPTSGKTTLAKQFIKYHPEFKLISVDDIRLEGIPEEEIWYEMGTRAVEATDCIVESSGVSTRLGPYVLDDLRLQARGILTVILLGDTEDLLQKLQRRTDTQEKPEIPFVYKSLSQEGLIKRFDKLIEGKYPLAWYLKTTNHTEESAYKEFERAVMKFKRELDIALTNM